MKFLKTRKKSIVILFICLCALTIIICYPSYTPSIKGENSIAEIAELTIGGVEQTILIRGQNQDNPILLKLHGGPGNPEMAISPSYHQELEKHFIVVNWDQRGSGKSYSSKIDPTSLTIQQLVSDTHELTSYLKKRFNKEKIYLLAHSFGTIVGLKEVAAHPNDYYAYIGISQIGNSIENDRLSYKKMLKLAKQHGMDKILERLTTLGEPPYEDFKDMTAFTNSLSQVPQPNVKSIQNDLLLKTLAAEEYRFTDYYRLLKGTKFSIEAFSDEIGKTNMFNEVKKVEVPVYFLTGIHDQYTVHEMQKKYFNYLEAPQKEFILFEQSSHFPHYEESEKFIDVLINRVLKNNRNS
ncbi:alpha/beta hydrolase [Bacillus timonensis]|nr:alpha/beta hydrolase [Bacillus timonensis]